MSISIVACPRCKTLLLHDTVQCHRCDYVLDPERAKLIDEHILPSDEAVSEDLDICTNCGETFRRGLVRCWNCGVFTRPEMAEAYRRMKEAQGVIVDDDDLSGPAVEATPARRSDGRNLPGTRPRIFSEPTLQATDDDFELSDDVQWSHGPETEAEPAVASVAELPAAATAPVEAETSETDVIESPAGQAGPPVPEIAHSEATGGDVLLDLAKKEEEEAKRGGRRRSHRIGLRGGFIVYCPLGHRIEVQERHRGRTGRCPRCKSVFHVPFAGKQEPKPAEETATESAVVSGSTGPVAGEFARWLLDVHLHTVAPEKLKLKAGSLAQDFQSVDIGFSPSQIMLVTLQGKGGLFGAGAKKKPQAREAVFAHLRENKSIDSLPAAAHTEHSAEAFRQLRVVQPAPPNEESMFAGIPVFGGGRIAVRLPKTGEQPQFLSFSLSEFRQFADAVATLYGISDLGQSGQIPMSDEVETVTCHYSEQPIAALKNVEYYQADPQFKVQIAGWRCEGCGLIVSEDSRRKEKIGGKSPNTVAKAKCPKCQKKFGNQPLYALAPEPVAVATLSAS